MKFNTADFWDILSDELKEEIKKASLQIEDDETIDYEEFIAKHRK